MNKILKKSETSNSKEKISKIKVFNIITLITSAISLAMAIAVIITYVEITTQFIKVLDYSYTEPKTKLLYANDAYKISTNLLIFPIILFLVAIINFVIGIMHSPKAMANVDEKDLKLQKIIKIVNTVGGLLIINGILAAIMLWRTKKNTLSFFAPMVIPFALLLIVPSVVQATTHKTLAKPIGAFKTLYNKKIVQVNEATKDIEIDLKALSEEMTKENLAYELTSPPRKITLGETFSEREFLRTWVSTNKTIVKKYHWNEKEEIHVWLNWDKNVKKYTLQI